MLAHLIAIGYFGAPIPAPLDYGFDEPGPVSDIIYRALRRIGAINARATLSPLQASQALSVLKSLIRQLPSAWIDVIGSEGYVAGEDERVYLATTVQAYLPTYINGDGTGTTGAYATGMRSPRDGAKVQIVDRATQTSETYLYRADIAQWMAVSTLAMTSQSPFSEDLDEDLGSVLSARLAEEYGVETTATVQQAAFLGWRRIKARCATRRTVGVEHALLINSRQTYGGAYITDS